MRESITIKFSLHAPALAIYNAWLNAVEHSQMTGAKATASRLVGGAFSAWDGYITGQNLLLIPAKKIVQSWRTTEFPEEAPDSVLSIQFSEAQAITEIEIEHKDIPPGQGVQYQSGWIEFYVNPMQKYFASKVGKVGNEKTTIRKPAKKSNSRKNIMKSKVRKSVKKTKSSGSKPKKSKGKK